MKQKLRYVLPVLIGLVAFYALVGPRVLDPTNVAFLVNGDPSQNYIGGLFYRQGPWSFPLGRNEAFGLDPAVTVILSDSLPLLSIPFKLIRGILPEGFQFLGWWLFGCILLQAVFAWKLMGLFTEDDRIKAIFSLFLSFSPVMIMRLGGHFNLSAHFLVLWSLYLYFLSVRDKAAHTGAWSAALVVAVLVHAYWVVMVGAIWLAGAIRLWLTAGGKSAAKHAGIVWGSLLFVAGITGYFTVGGGASAGSGFGFWKMNLLSIVDGGGWSYILRDLPQKPGDYEGFNYLGLGALMFIVAAVPLMAVHRADIWKSCIEHRWLLLACLGLTVLAVSNVVTVGDHEFVIPLPNKLTMLGSTFRASGRFFWVCYYLIFLSFFVIFVQYAKNRKLLVLGLFVAFLVQVADTSPAWRGIHHALMATKMSAIPSPFKNSFWNELAAQSDKIRYVPYGHDFSRWRDLSYFAWQHHMGSDTVYLARNPQSMFERSQKAQQELFEGHKVDPKAIYIVDEKAVARMARIAKATGAHLARLDGMNVFFAQDVRLPTEAQEIAADDFLAEAVPGVFSTAGNAPGGKYLLEGWSWEEPWGRWSEGESSILGFKNTAGIKTVTLDCGALVQSNRPVLRMEVTVNGRFWKTVDVAGRTQLTIPVPAEPRVEISFAYRDPKSPKDLRINGDMRVLSLSVMSVKLE